MTEPRPDIREVLLSVKSELGELSTNSEGSQCVNVSLYDQYMENGKLDYVKITAIFKLLSSKKEFNKAVKEIFPNAKFHTVRTSSTITKEEFAKLYSFGLFPRVRNWQRAVYTQTGKYITIEDLYRWVLELG